MPQRRARVATATGLHARPASILTQVAEASGHQVSIGRGDGGPPVDAGSILSVLGLQLKRGDEVVVSAESDAATALLDELAELLATDLDAEGGQ